MILLKGSDVAARSFSRSCLESGPAAFSRLLLGGNKGTRRSAVTLIELLCVIVIIGILASLLLPAVLRAYLRTKEFDEEMEGPSIIEMIRNESRRYCVGHSVFQFSSKDDFVRKCEFAPKASQWVQGSRTDFVPFSNLDPTNRIVVSVHYGRKQASWHGFTVGELSLPAE